MFWSWFGTQDSANSAYATPWQPNFACSFIVYKNGGRLAVAFEDLAGELCCTTIFDSAGGSVRFTAKLPPLD